MCLRAEHPEIHPDIFFFFTDTVFVLNKHFFFFSSSAKLHHRIKKNHLPTSCFILILKVCLSHCLDKVNAFRAARIVIVFFVFFNHLVSRTSKTNNFLKSKVTSSNCLFKTVEIVFDIFSANSFSSKCNMS